jgi:hypothetical protein
VLVVGGGRQWCRDGRQRRHDAWWQAEWWQDGPGKVGGGGTPSASASVPPGGQRVQLVVNPQPLGGVKNPAGAVVDGFVPATFRMRVGVPVAVTVRNYDDMPHTWTSTALGVDAAIPAGTAN